MPRLSPLVLSLQRVLGNGEELVSPPQVALDISIRHDSSDHLGTILVALTSDEPGEELYSLGFNDAFKKPFDGALLAERVRRLISQKKADEP